MTDEEILEIVNRLEQAVEFRKAKSHVEQLECRDHLRIRTNRDGCLSFGGSISQRSNRADVPDNAHIEKVSDSRRARTAVW